MSQASETPIVSYPTPNMPRPVTVAEPLAGDAMIVEVWDSKVSDYVAIEYGTPHPDTVRFPGYKLVYQKPINDGNEENRLVQKVWAKNRTGQDNYNAAIKLVQEGYNYPIYIRSYMVPRGTALLADESKLTTVVGLTLNNGGTGYTGDEFDRIDLSFGGPGTGAEGYGIVVGGVITNVYITDGGDGYVTAPAVSAAGGAGLDVTAIIQSQEAYLVSQSSQPAPEPYTSLYDVATRVYHTLPGPTLLQWVWNKTLRTFIRIAKTIIKASLVPDTVYTVTTPGEIIEYQPIDKNRAVKIVSSIAAAPDTYTVPTVVGRFPLPDQIIGTPQLYYVWAQAGDGSFAMDVGLFINIREGYNGPYKGRVTQVFTFDPTTIVLPTLTVFNPQAHNIGVAFYYFSSNQALARATNFSIPQTIHPALILTPGGSTGSGTAPAVSLPATVPTTLPAAGTWIPISASAPQQVDLDVWMYEYVEILMEATFGAP